jgi:predicted aldo/keto reductase-like oxidoreductase
MESSKNDLTRRGFLTASISGLVGAGLAGFSPSIVLAQENIKQQKTEGKLIYRNLGKTGMKVPVVSMGVMRVEGGPALIQAAYEKGIIHFDSASAYMSGRNEQMVGRTINKLKARDKVIIATNILYVHDIASVDEARQPGLVESMKELKESGKVKAIGISTHSNMAAILNDAAQSGDWDVVLTSFNLTMADDTEMLNALKAASDKGIGIVAMKTLAGGSGWPNLEGTIAPRLSPAPP